MAKENITKFLEAAMTDKTFAEKVASLAGESGYDVTAEELLKLGTQRPMSDEEAEAAAGGDGGRNPFDDPRYKSPTLGTKKR